MSFKRLIHSEKNICKTKSEHRREKWKNFSSNKLFILKEVIKMAKDYNHEYELLYPGSFTTNLTGDFVSMIGDNEEDSSLFNKKES